MKEHFSDNTYSLLKAMYHTKIAMDYFDDVAKGYQGSAKHLMLSYVQKCKYIIDNIRHRMPAEMITDIDNDLKDSLFIDAIEEKIIHFNQQQRDSLEAIVEMMYRGTPVEVKINSNMVNDMEFED